MFVSYITGIMSGTRRGPGEVFVSWILRILSLLYSVGVKIVGLAYTSGIRRVHKAPLPVVSVGNLTLGGTGKTPMVIFLAEHFLETGEKPAILTRGYGNDESRMLLEELPEVPVYAGQDRLKSAVRSFGDGREVAILDDGFQHRRIDRDLNILLLDGRNLLGSGLIFPAGPLREPVGSARRADIVVITKTDGFTKEKLEKVREYAKKIAPGKPMAIARHAPVSLRRTSGCSFGLETLKFQDICVVSGIADPAYFEDVLKGLSAVIMKKYSYPDHHAYTQKDLDFIAEDCAGLGIRTIVTTAKDLVKMRDLDMTAIDDKVLVLEVKIEITEGKELLLAGLDSIFSRNSR